MKKEQWYYFYCAFLVVFLAISSIYYMPNRTNKSDPQAEELKTVLINEYEHLQPLPGAILVDSNRVFRNGNGFIFYRYSTESNFKDILSYYDKQLQANGWTFLRDEEVRNGTFDNHERRAVYSKGEYLASVGYGFKENENHIRFVISFEKPVK